ncbi:uncharacterized protein LOC113554186 [Rhopalosiphum maidis]|uniref:uncharacterized protein LOC113554186 n=1 Tax=Rhopalosiphum maidis TaxID=43146 RepID=UPI000F002556|nr:uncharacterized protein LOC113554186 [Rhopalosiphum maidis]
MKKPAGVFITLYLIFTISGITCDENNSCKSINEVCADDKDCCYQKCSFSLFHFQRYCNDNTNVFSSITSYFSTKEQIGICSYTEPTNMSVSKKMYGKFGLNAAHAALPSGTIVEVKLNDKKLMVTINDSPLKSNEEILQFSNEAAKVLNIKSGESMACNIIVPRMENNQYLKYLNYVLPYVSLFSLLFSFI